MLYDKQQINYFTLIFAIIFCVAHSNAQSLPITSYGTWDRGGKITNFADPNVDFVLGIEASEKWESIELVKGTFDFSSFQTELDKAYANNKLIRFSIDPGPDAPLWMYDNDTDSTNNPYPQVKKIFTSGGNAKTSWPFYPQYLTQTYKDYFFELIRQFSLFLRNQPQAKFNLIAFVQVKTGCTGDETPFKGNIINPSDDISNTVWDNFRAECFNKYKLYFNDVSTRKIPLIFNNIEPDGNPIIYNWIMTQIDPTIGGGIKGGAYNRGHHLTGEQPYKDLWTPFLINPQGLKLFSASEMDQTWQQVPNGYFTLNPDLGFYWAALAAINVGLSTYNLSADAMTYVTTNASTRETFRMYNRYAQQVYPASATTAFSVFHEGLNSANTNKFSEAKYGKSTMTNVSRYKAICNDSIYKSRGASVDDTISVIQGQVFQRANQTGFNDAGWDIAEGNIERFFTQINPDTTSIGLFRVRGTITASSSKYDRFARSFENATGKNRMYFKFDSTVFTNTLPDTLQFKIIWLDKTAGSTWSFRYKSPSSIKDAVQVTGIGDNTWKTVTFTIADAIIDQSGVIGSDFTLVNTDTKDDIFNSIEVTIKRKSFAGLFTNTITGTNPSASNPYTSGQTKDVNITVSGIGRGAGLTGATANDIYSASGWSTSSIDLSDYFEFTLTPNSGYEIDFSTFSYTGQASGTGPNSFAFRSSLDNYTSNIGLVNSGGTTISLLAATYQNITTPITFRFYGWEASAGTYSINDFIFTGNVLPISNYYLQNNVASTASNWNSSTNGSGTVLGSLTAANINLIVDNETNASFSSNLVLGNNSKIIVSQGTTAKLTIAGASLTGTVDVGNAGTLVLSTSTIPTLGVLAAGSTIVYNFAGNQTLTSTASYANVTLSGSGIKTLANAVTLSGTLTVASGVTLDATNTILSGTGSINVQSGATLIVGNVGGINGFNKTTGISTYSTGANYTFNGTNTQILGAVLPNTVNNLTLSNGNNVLALNASQTINGALLFSGGTDLLVGNNTLTLNGTVSGMSVNNCLKTSNLSNISIGGGGVVGTLFFDTINNALNNLTINNSFTSGAALTLGNTLKICGVVTPTAGQLATGNNLILVSTTVSGGGSIGDATGNSFVATNNYITGNVTVQRYSRPQRGYRTFGHPFSTAQNLGMLTDNFAITGLTTLGIGMYASSASVPTAFLYDPTQTAGSKAVLTKLYDATANLWTVGRGLYVFVRGAGNEGMAGSGAINYSGIHNPVIIDGTGAINQGSFVYNLGYGGTGKDNYNLIGNPYPCPINLKNVGGIGTFGTVYVYNPIKNLSLADEYKLAGGFDQYTNNGSTDIIIPSFGAFYVQNTRSNKFITFNENNKAVGLSPTYAVFGIGVNPTIRLTVANVNGDIDELKFGFDSSSTDASTDKYDAAKLGNSLFNFYSISSDKKSLAIDYRKHLNSIIPLGVQTALTNSYSIRLSELTDLPNTQVVLKDKFLNKVTTLSQVGDSYTFDITADTASQGENRFQINFFATTLPVQIVDVSAQLQANRKVAVNWKSTTEVNITTYKIQRSNDGNNFSTVGMVVSKGGGNYRYDDDLANENALLATMYYRIEAVDKDGSKMYSRVVAVALGGREEKTAINIYPNPVHATLNAQVTIRKTGEVQLRIIDTKGKIVATQQKKMSLGTHSELIPVAKLAAGSYILELESAEGKQHQHFLKE